MHSYNEVVLERFNKISQENSLTALISKNNGGMNYDAQYLW
nr:MAG TPA: hypothetical protein [Inoviridae sp.]